MQCLFDDVKTHKKPSCCQDSRPQVRSAKNTHTMLFCGFSASPAVFCGASCSFPDSPGVVYGVVCGVQAYPFKYVNKLTVATYVQLTFSSPILLRKPLFPHFAKNRLFNLFTFHAIDCIYFYSRHAHRYKN